MQQEEIKQEVTVSITYDMPFDYSHGPLERELKKWLEGKITVPDVVHGEIIFHWMRTKAWTDLGNVISIKGGGLFRGERKPLTVQEMRALAGGNWSGKWWW